MAKRVVKFESALIYTFAERLYAEAGHILVTYPLIGAVLAAGIAAGVGRWTEKAPTAAALAVAAAIGAVIGFYIARERAFQLRLRAQLALCNVAIEENTRRA